MSLLVLPVKAAKISERMTATDWNITYSRCKAKNLDAPLTLMVTIRW
jgi:hypothetical protein